MHKGKTIISARHWLAECLILPVEAFLWAGCFRVASLLLHTPEADAPRHFAWLAIWGWGLAALFVASRLIPAKLFSRTARRDEVAAQAMKTALTACILLAAIAPRPLFEAGASGLQSPMSCPQPLLAGILFCIAMTMERLILNRWFVRYAVRHGRHGVIICDEDTAWQQKALQQNTYGLKLSRLDGQSAAQLEAFLEAHPRTGDVYCSASALPPAELETVAHICREQRLSLHILPLAPCAMPQTMRSECRGTVGVLSPAKTPLQSLAARTVKRLTDIVLSLLVLLTIFPAFALIAFICIKRQSRGPVLVARHLCGMDGKVFQCLTFRTRHYEAAPSFFDDTGDPGYFPFGKFLRHTRLELLPQFLCVFRGSMTIVGPQAMRPEQYAGYRQELEGLFAPRCRPRAGIASFRFPSQAKNSARADVWYCRNWGFWLDIRIMLHCLGTFLNSSKAKPVNYI